MHIDNIKALAQSAHNNPDERERLFSAILGGEGKDAYYAAWALTHLPTSDNIYINMYRARLTDFAIATPDTSMRRLALALLERLEWTVDDIRTDLLDFCLEHMMLPSEPYGIKALCIKLAYQQCRHYPELKAELRNALLLLEPSELGAGVKHTRKKTLERL
ncbi:MAG: hypothetical protein IKP21_06180 [Bacteroidales bacterium]|nr:hypothetical protein [Bacteroidales bacterium]